MKIEQKLSLKPLTELQYFVGGLRYYHLKKCIFRRECAKLLPPTVLPLPVKETSYF
jgi:hypothetical protein